MELIIYRDTEHIGGSSLELRSKGGSRILLDLGIPLFTEEGDRLDFGDCSQLSGKGLLREGILPQIEGLYKWDKNEAFDGVLISHAHLDHYGLFNYVKESIPFYLGKATKELIDITTLFTPVEGKMDNYRFFSSGNTFILGDFKITPYLMDHSAFDAYAFLVEGDGKRVIYTGDFRCHGRKKKVLDYFLNDVGGDIDAIILEGSNLGLNKGEIRSEESIEEEVVALAQEEKPILLYASAQNIDRLVSFYRAAKRSGRTFVIDIYTANILSRLKDFAKLPHLSLDFEEIKVFYPYYLTKRAFKEGLPNLMYKFSKYKISKEEVVEEGANLMILVRDSIFSDLEKIDQLGGGNIFKKGILIYSMWEGYLEEGRMDRMKEFIRDKDMQLHKIHTSGHASYPTLKKVVDKLQPKEIIPIHTMNPQSYHELGFKVTRLKNYQKYEI